MERREWEKEGSCAPPETDYIHRSNMDDNLSSHYIDKFYIMY